MSFLGIRPYDLNRFSFEDLVELIDKYGSSYLRCKISLILAAKEDNFISSREAKEEIIEEISHL